jgi:hypothetical protein
MKEPVNGGCGHLYKGSLFFRPELEHAFLPEHAHNLREKRCQVLGTYLSADFLDLQKASLYVRGVHPWPSLAVQVFWLSSVPKEPNGGLLVVTGKGHEFVQNQSFLPVACLKVPGPPGFYQLGYTDLGHWFLLSVTQFMRNR